MRESIAPTYIGARLGLGIEKRKRDFKAGVGKYFQLPVFIFAFKGRGL
jgi:hypothetical protein